MHGHTKCERSVLGPMKIRIVNGELLDSMREFVGMSSRPTPAAPLARRCVLPEMSDNRE
jgi:hypothetical protein